MSKPTTDDQSSEKLDGGLDEWDKRIFSTGCAAENTTLNDCFFEKKDWRKCKMELENFKRCWKTKENDKRTEMKDV